MGNRILPTLWLGVSGLFLVACSTEEPVSTSASPSVAVAESGISITALSTKPWLITGGDVLIEIALIEDLNMAQLSVRLDDRDVSNEFRQVSSQRVQALLHDLPLGSSTLTAGINGTSPGSSLTLTNYSISGPIISGPHEQPFYCQTEQFETVAGDFLGEPVGANCSAITRVDYVYWSDLDEKFKPLPQGLADDMPEDIGMIDSAIGIIIPFVVRVETGTVNRAVYEIAMLHDPAAGQLDPWNKSSHWNGKLVYTHGGGCRSGWHLQGIRTGGVMRRGLFEQGYAIASSTLNVFGQNCFGRYLPSVNH